MKILPHFLDSPSYRLKIRLRNEENLRELGVRAERSLVVVLDVEVPREEAARVGMKDELDGREGAVEGEAGEVGRENLGGEDDGVRSWVERHVLVRAGETKSESKDREERRKKGLTDAVTVADRTCTAGATSRSYGGSSPRYVDRKSVV